MNRKIKYIINQLMTLTLTLVSAVGVISPPEAKAGVGIRDPQLPKISVSQGGNFGVVRIGESSSRTVTVKNYSSKSFRITSVSANSDFSASWSGIVGARKSVQIPVRFSPSKIGRIVGNVRIYTDISTWPWGGNRYFDVRAQGYGKAAVPTPTKVIRIVGDLHFGEVYKGRSKWKRVAIHNDGNSNMRLTGFSLPAGFTTTLKPGIVQKNSVVRGLIYFRPKEVRQFLGNFVVYSDKTAGVSHQQISGVGKIVIPSVEPYIRTTGSVSFGNVAIGTAATRPVIVSNVGKADLVITRIAAPSGFSTPSLSLTLKPGQSRTIHIRFLPTQARGYAGRLSIASNAANSAAALTQLSGVGKQKVSGIPNAYIKRSNSGYVGASTINSSGANQTITGTTRQNKKRTKVYYMTVRNQGEADSFRVHGSQGGSKFGVRYYYISGGRTTDVTTAVTRGTFVIHSLAANGTSGLLKLEVKPRNKAVKGNSKTCTITTRSLSKSRKVDVVKAVTTIN